jgi:hypothetical protein
VAESGTRAGDRAGASAPDPTVLPGVVDRHVHLGLVAHRELAGSPVVEVHDLGWDPAEIRGIAAELGGGTVDRRSPGGSETHPSDRPRGDVDSLRSLNRRVRAVRVRYAGPFHAAPGGYPSGRSWAPTACVRGIETVADAADAVSEALAAGSSAIKITLHADFPALSDELLAALVSAARAAGLPAVVHAEGAGQARRAIEAGAAALVHAPWTERLPDEVLALSAARGVEWISTLAIHSGDDLERALDNARRYAALGGRVSYGTDLGNGPAPVGVNEREIELLGEIGLNGERLLEAVMPAADPAGFLASPEPPPRTAAELIAWLRAAHRIDPSPSRTAHPSSCATKESQDPHDGFCALRLAPLAQHDRLRRAQNDDEPLTHSTTKEHP